MICVSLYLFNPSPGRVALVPYNNVCCDIAFHACVLQKWVERVCEPLEISRQLWFLHYSSHDCMSIRDLKIKSSSRSQSLGLVSLPTPQPFYLIYYMAGNEMLLSGCTGEKEQLSSCVLRGLGDPISVQRDRSASSERLILKPPYSFLLGDCFHQRNINMNPSRYA